MCVQIRKMTEAEFEIFYQWSIENHALELTEELQMTRDQAIREAITEINEMLPHGFHTECSNLMTIVAENENAGFIWTVYEETEGKQQVFVCDFAIWESRRRKGYGAAALSLAEKDAAEAGCHRSVLFVRDDNDAARSLYKKCGYQFLQQKGYGYFMAKQLL